MLMELFAEGQQGSAPARRMHEALALPCSAAAATFAGHPCARSWPGLGLRFSHLGSSRAPGRQRAGI